MATPSFPVEPNEEECSVCHEQFTEPKLLPCGHLLCRRCLLSWLKSQTEAKCPLCRCAIVEPGELGSKSLEDIADGFPTDLAMAALVEADRLLNKGHNCCICEDAAATCICLNCRDMFCQTCRTVHNRQSLTKHHTVEDLSSLTPDKIAANRPATCAVHADKTCELFCPTHGVSICHVCAMSRHRSCPEVKDLEEKVEEARAVLAELTAMLSAGETELGTAISQLDQQLRETEKRTRAAIAEMEATCDRLESAIKACRRRLKELAETAVSDVKEAMHAGKTCLLQRRGKLTSHKRVVERVQEMTTRDDPQDMTSVMRSRVNDLDFSVALPADAKVIPMVTLVIDPEAVSSLERELLKLGQVMTIPADVTAQVLDSCSQREMRLMLRFHDNHGKNIVLSNQQETAERTGSNSDGGIVVSCDPMRTSMLYEVRLDKRDGFNENYMWVGVTTAAPDTLTVPDDAGRWTSAVVINNSSVDVNGEHTNSKVGQKLVDLPRNSRVGVLIDDSRSLHLYINGQDQGVAASHLPQSCFAFFDVYGPYRQVTALPVQRVP